MTKRKAPAKPARKARKPLPADARLRDRPSLPVPSRRSRVYNRNVVAVSPFFSPTQGAIPGSGFAFTAAQSRRSMAENLQTSPGSANADLSGDLQVLRERSRALVRNNPLAAGAIRTTVSNVIGTGLQVQSKIDGKYLGLSRDEAKAWQDEAERRFRWWSSSRTCDVAGRLTFEEMQALVERSSAENGDCFALRRQSPPASMVSFQLQLAEADRVCNPVGRPEGYRTPDGGYITQGVEIGSTGRTAGYHVADQHPGHAMLGPVSIRWSFVPARGATTDEWLVLHIGHADRIDQARGIPLLAPVVEPLHQLSEYARIELTRCAVASLFTAFVKTPEGAGLAPEETTDAVSSQPENYRMGPGSILDLAMGEDVVLADPKGQGPAFDAFVQSILRQIGPAIGIPLEILTLHFQSSYSAARGALLEAWKFFRIRRASHVRQFCEPVWDAFVADLVASGQLNAPGFFEDPMVRQAYTRSEWIGPTPGQLDPLQEVNAAAARINLGLSSTPQECAALTGGDWESVHEQQVQVAKRRKADGLDQEQVAERVVSEASTVSTTTVEEPASAADKDEAEASEA